MLFENPKFVVYALEEAKGKPMEAWIHAVASF
jgi:hypothetical protein